MKAEKRTDHGQLNSQGKIHPLDPREYPLARDARGVARREEIRAQTPRLSAPRQSNRPVDRSNQKQTHNR